ncbi:MAG: hypothetical protein ACPGNR_06070, partial [Paracoccaceae bacterium]
SSQAAGRIFLAPARPAALRMTQALTSSAVFNPCCCLKRAIQEVKSSQCAFFLLFGNRPLYAASGFKPVANKVRYTSLIGVKTGEVVEISDSGLMVMPLGSALWDETAVIDLAGHAF